MAGTLTLTHLQLGQVRRIEFSVVADAADGSIPATALPAIEGRLLALHTNPGATAPTANYDITLVDGDGLDRLQGVGANRHTTNSEQAAIVYATTSVHPPVSIEETLTLTFANNIVNSALITGAILYTPSV